MKTFFFFLESTSACVLGPWPRIFFCVLGLGLEPCVLDSTSGAAVERLNNELPNSVKSSNDFKAFVKLLTCHLIASY